MMAAIAVASCFAADVDGKLAGKINTARGDVPISFDLKAEGDKVTGTAVGAQRELPVNAGLYADGRLSFQLRYQFSGQNLVFLYEGVPADDEMKMTLGFGINEPVHFFVKRQPPETTGKNESEREELGRGPSRFSTPTLEASFDHAAERRRDLASGDFTAILGIRLRVESRPSRRQSHRIKMTTSVL